MSKNTANAKLADVRSPLAESGKIGNLPKLTTVPDGTALRKSKSPASKSWQKALRISAADITVKLHGNWQNAK